MIIKRTWAKRECKDNFHYHYTNIRISRKSHL